LPAYQGINVVKNLILFGVSIALLSLKPINVQHGTLVVGLISQTGDYVAVGSESRNLDKNLKPIDDRACKVISLGKSTVFFETGSSIIGVLRGTNWDARTIARTAYRRAKVRDSESLSVAWGNLGLRWFYGQPVVDLKSIADPEDGGIVTGGFVNFVKNDGQPLRVQSVFYSEATNSIGRRPQTPPTGLGKVFVAGTAKELVAEFFEGKTIRAQTAFGPLGKMRRIGEDPNVDSELVRKAIQFAMDNSTGQDHTALGGPIDIAIVRSNKTVEWVSRKQECYKQDEPQSVPGSAIIKDK
jgi:hypothetical protein